MQQDIGRGMIVEVAYVGNVAHRIANSNTLGAAQAANYNSGAATTSSAIGQHLRQRHQRRPAADHLDTRPAAPIGPNTSTRPRAAGAPAPSIPPT